MTLTILDGTPSLRAIAVAASGSVGAQIAPSVKATAHDMSSTSACATTATAPAVSTTRPIALSVIGRHSSFMSRGEAK